MLSCFEECGDDTDNPIILKRCEDDCEARLSQNARVLYSDLFTCASTWCEKEVAAKTCTGWLTKDDCLGIEGCFFGDDGVCSSTDSMAPVFQNCPLDFEVTTRYGTDSRLVSWVEIGALDQGDPIEVKQLSELGSGDIFTVGSSPYQVRYSAEDSHGNFANCTFFVKVEDVWPPKFSLCPEQWSITLAAPVTQTVIGSDGRYYTPVSWTQPVAMDNVDIQLYYRSIDVDVHVGTFPGVDNIEPSFWAQVPNRSDDRMVNPANADNSGPTTNWALVPISTTESSQIVYIAKDSAGLTSECPLIIHPSPSYRSYFQKSSRSVPATPSDAGSDWVNSVVVARYTGSVPTSSCANRCLSQEACTGFMVSNDDSGECVILQNINNEDGTEFSFNWDYYAKIDPVQSVMDCSTFNGVDACFLNLEKELTSSTASVNQATATVCTSSVTDAQSCVNPLLTNCSNPLIQTLTEVKLEHSLSMCTSSVSKPGRARRQVDAPVPSATPCGSGDLFTSLPSCLHTCCEATFDKAEDECRVITPQGILGPSDARVKSCLETADDIRETCTSQCLSVRPFDPLFGTAYINNNDGSGSENSGEDDETSGSSSGSDESGSADGDNGFPPEGKVDLDFEILVRGIAPEELRTSRSRSSVILGMFTVYGVDMNAQKIAVKQDGKNIIVSVRARVDQTAVTTFDQTSFLAQTGDSMGHIRAQILHEQHVAYLQAQGSGNSLNFEPTMTGYHDDNLLRFLKWSQAVLFGPVPQAHLNVTLFAEGASLYSETTTTQGQFTFTNSAGANTTVTTTQPGVGVTLTVDLGDGSDNDADTDAAGGNDATMSSGVLAFSIIVPIFVVMLLVLLYVSHRNHKKVRVMPTGLLFQEPVGMQALPNRGIPEYPDRTITDVKGDVPKSMPFVDSQNDPFATKVTTNT